MTYQERGRMLAKEFVPKFNLTTDQEIWLYKDIGNYFCDAVEVTDQRIIDFINGWCYRLR